MRLRGIATVRMSSARNVRTVRDGEEALYAVSIAITEILPADVRAAKDGPSVRGFDALQYPTTALDARGDNLAVRAHFAEQHLALVRAHLMRVIDSTPPNVVWLGIDTAEGVDDDGRLLWSGVCTFDLPGLRRSDEPTGLESSRFL